MKIREIGLVAGALIVAIGLVALAEAQGPKTASTIRPGAPMEDGMKQAMFGAGCFWGVEAAFRQIEGVVDTAVGYAGGHTKEPTYEEVCAHGTGHAEVVHVTYDPEIVSYDRLLEVFWSVHNPTTKNRQGPDVGSQYRSAIFVYDDSQRTAAEASKQALDESDDYPRPVVTEITDAGTFWRAEEYHQQYYEKTGRGGCPSPFR
jgi:peptide-methionine (S)-S-oxide reductase